MNNLRVSFSKKEIINILKRIQQDSDVVFIWQNVGETREIVYCHIEKIDVAIGNFCIRPIDPNQTFHIEKKLSLYVKGELESILFKQEIAFASEGMVILKFPPEVRIIEKRLIQREAFEVSDEKKITIAKYAPNSQKPRRFDLILLDISHAGVAFFITPTQLLSFGAGDQIYLLEVGGRKLSNPLSATVKYVTRYTGTTEDVRGHRVGTHFLEPLAKEFLEIID